MTSKPLQTRSLATDLEIRGGDGRTVVGIAAPFDSPTEIREGGVTFTESIQRGAFTRTIAERGDRVKLLAQHDRQSMPLGRATHLEERKDGLYAEFRVSQTTAGDEALQLISDGALDGLSIGFRVIRDDWTDGGKSRVLREVRLDEVSLVNFPAYQDALVSGLRAEDELLDAEQLRAALQLALEIY